MRYVIEFPLSEVPLIFMQLYRFIYLSSIKQDADDNNPFEDVEVQVATINKQLVTL
jgi:hypothetical protein